METENKARNVAASLLSSRMYTCQELVRRLCRKGYERDLAERVVSEFIELGLLDDTQYAKLYVEDAVKLGAKGWYRIRQELMQKGVARSIIDEAIEACEADTGSALRDYVAQRNLQEQIHSRRDLENLKARLARRGYSLSEIRECLAEYQFQFEEDV